MKKAFVIKTCVLGIVILFFNVGFVSALNVNLLTEFKPLNNDNWLYVGGSGPGNYTKIQDAIDNASNDDTVFVYNDSSPYYENIIIEKSINLIGENRETTVILGDESSDGIIVNISADDVNISSFTIQPHQGNPSGIYVYKNYTSPDYWNIGIIQNVTIFNNIIKKIYGAGIFGIRLNNGNIYGNIIENCEGSGIYLFISSNNTIKNNVITDCAYRGIEINGLWSPFRIKNYLNPIPENNVITYNIINSNRWGISLNSGSTNTKISYNNITNHQGNFPGQDGIGISIYQAYKTQITNNNFIDNSINSYFNVINILRYPRFIQNSWDSNFWGEQKNFPVRINGTFCFIPFPRLPFSISFPNYQFNYHEFTCIVFDWHPAKEPYNIMI